MTAWAEISAHISQVSGHPFRGIEQREIPGGSINRAYLCSDAARRYFVKLNRASRAGMFAAEAEGLLELRKSGAIRIPEPLCWGVAGSEAYMVLEYIELRPSTEFSSNTLGAQLAQMHRHTSSQFGWHRDNTIGSTPQHNAWTASWPQFWRDQRLGFQIEWASKEGHRGTLIDRLEQVRDAVPVLLQDHHPAPSLLHGDLWGGNYAADTGGQPVLFDPAVYYGDRETDLAMTELFGGFGAHFYQAYRSAYPLVAGYEVRRTLYNLYHVLNHLNLFGGGYARQAEQMAEQLISELR